MTGARPTSKRLAVVFAPFHPRLRGTAENLPFHFDAATLSRGMNFTLTTDLGDLDLFGEVVGVGGYDEVRAQSDSWALFSRLCAVLSLEGLIQSKRAAARAKDLLVIPELEALHEIELHATAQRPRYPAKSKKPSPKGQHKRGPGPRR